MTNFSHSKINTFKQCKYKYKLQYIDFVKVEIPTTIEMFMGNNVHKTLEILHKELTTNLNKNNKEKIKNQLIKTYKDLWLKNWDDNILIVKKDKTNQDYFLTGYQHIINYFEKYFPFNDMEIIGLETKKFLHLNEQDKYHIRIDKLGKKENTYYVCDYKTNSRLKTQKEANEDEQLAMYSLWVKENFRDVKEIILLWYFLEFNKTIKVKKTNQELDEIKKRILNTIEEIKSTKTFEPKISPLCQYCIYKDICPAFSNRNNNSNNNNNNNNHQKRIKDFF